jgi:hypothetical protein
MNYEGFVVYCFNQGINPEIIRACKTAVMKDDYVLGNSRNRNPADNLGYSELGDIVTVEQAIKEIKESIWMSVCDYDNLGRSLQKVRTRQLIKNPHKALTRIILKTYYLLGGTR